ncbi:MAG: phosphatase PAP2 family protein [Chromatiales bacterium]|nr:phosphatase PAP2 family protein [Chromatiales bacterium]
MHSIRPASWRRVLAVDLDLCIRCNRLAAFEPPRRLFALVSRLGDGIFWYTLMLMLPVIYGLEAIVVSLQMAGVALAGLLLYKQLKGRTSRQRPFQVTPAIQVGTAPLDHFSFPSGHTLHAVAFSLVAVGHYPELSWFLVPFTALVMASRVVLGLHYPSDVIAGAVLGAAIAQLSFQLI